MNETRSSYLAEWKSKTGKSGSEIYIPRALQPNSCYLCGWARKGTDLTVKARIDGPGNHVNCPMGRW